MAALTYVCACKLPNGLNIGGGIILRGAVIGQEEHQLANAPGRERIAGYEITRDIPADIWERWYGENANSPIIHNKLVMGFLKGDDQALNEFCWANVRMRGWRQASQEGSSS